jgi:hypothetical protein
MSPDKATEKPLNPSEVDVEAASPKPSTNAEDELEKDFITVKKLALIVLAVALAMFLVALVSFLS